MERGKGSCEGKGRNSKTTLLLLVECFWGAQSQRCNPNPSLLSILYCTCVPRTSGVQSSKCCVSACQLLTTPCLEQLASHEYDISQYLGRHDQAFQLPWSPNLSTSIFRFPFHLSINHHISSQSLFQPQTMCNTTFFALAW